MQFSEIKDHKEYFLEKGEVAKTVNLRLKTDAHNAKSLSYVDLHHNEVFFCSFVLSLCV